MAKIVFFQKDLHEKFGVMSLSSYLKKHGHECEVFCNSEEDDIIKEIKNAKPDLIGCSVMIGEINFISETLHKIKKVIKNVPCIVGGPLTLIYPEEIISLPEVDMVFLGDGELGLLNLLENKDPSTIDGLWYKKAGKIIKNDKLGYINNLQELPPVDWDLYADKYPKIKKQKTRNFFISRGCVYQCTYCYAHCIANIYRPTGVHFRTRGIKQCIEEIKHLTKTTEVKYIRFQDASLTINKPFLIEFLKEYSKEKLPKFICYSRIEDGINEQVINALHEAGCDRIQFGLQSFERIRNMIGRRVDDQTVMSAVKLVQEKNMRVGVDLMFGFPTETTEESLASLKFYNKLMPIEISSNVLMVYPKTKIWEHAFKNNYISNTAMEKINRDSLTIKQKNINQLKNVDAFSYYFIKYPKLLYLLKWLIYLPPNKFFSVLKNLHLLIIGLKYDSRGFLSSLEIGRAHV